MELKERSHGAIGAPEGPPSTFFGRFRLLRLLGSGGFGDVYRGVQESNGELVAIKVEKIVTNSSFLFHEAKMMMHLKKFGEESGRGQQEDAPYAAFRYFGYEGWYRVLVMDLLGVSVERILEQRKRFSMDTTLMIACHMVSNLEYIHSGGIIHRDLKPDNMVLGRGEKKKKVYLIDFGLSSRYIGSDGRHREQLEGKSLVGTARYASARTHEGFSQSRRDDIEQLVYVMIYLYRGRLPWSGLQIRDRREKERQIGMIKREMPLDEICAGCPRSFVLLLNYARKMKFEETPAYEMIRGLLKQRLSAPVEDWVFDWDQANAEVLSPVQATAGSTPPPPEGRHEGPMRQQKRQEEEVPYRNQRGKDDEEKTMPHGVPRARSPELPLLQSDAYAQGILSGPQSQDITSLGSHSSERLGDEEAPREV